MLFGFIENVAFFQQDLSVLRDCISWIFVNFFMLCPRGDSLSFSYSLMYSWLLSCCLYRLEVRWCLCLCSDLGRPIALVMFSGGDLALERIPDYLYANIVCLFWWESVDGWLYLTDNLFLSDLSRCHCEVRTCWCLLKSNHTIIQHKKSAINLLVHRAFTISDKEHL